jgi:hypothetical protein
MVMRSPCAGDTHTSTHTHTSGFYTGHIVASVVDQEVAGELEKRQRKRWYWWRCRRRC